jgi:hypothetical protein
MTALVADSPLPYDDRLLRALGRVESLPPDAAGALALGDPRSPWALVLVERNRVCWGVVAGQSRRLRDLLRTQLGYDDDELEALYARCRDEGLPLGEALVDEGLVTWETLRAVMKAHTVESLVAIDTRVACAEPEWPLAWIERDARGYNPRFTFTAAELLAGAGVRMLDPLATELLDAHLDALADCAVVATSGRRVVGVRGPLRVTELAELSDWAEAALDASPGFSPVVAHAYARLGRAGAVAWRHDSLLCAAVAPTGAALQRLVSELDRHAYPMVLSTQPSVLHRISLRMNLPTG